MINFSKICLSSLFKRLQWQDLNGDFKKELSRKIFHISFTLIFPIIYIFLDKKQMLFIVIPLSFLIIAIDFSRHKNPVIARLFSRIFNKILREKELQQNSWTGASFIALSALIVFILCPKIIAICAFFILAISDSLAALVGKILVSRRFFEKSLAGSAVFLISAFLILIVCGIFVGQSFGYYLFGTFAVLAITIIEARPSFLRLDDNLTIPLSFSLIMMFFALMWNLQF